MGGVRAFGFGNTIANNYFYKLGGEGIRSAVILGSGSTDVGTLSALTNGSNGAQYETANYTHVIGNTFIDCKTISLDNANSEPVAVYGTQFLNNVISYSSNIGANGMVGYMSPQGGSDATTSIGTLVMAIARRKDLTQFKQAAAYLKQQSQRAEQQVNYRNYTRYYRAQALFQADVEAWQQWNNALVQQLKIQRQPDGSLAAQNGPDGGQIAGTSLTLLSLAVNFRFLPIYER
jgi:hypothetical protein